MRKNQGLAGFVLLLAATFAAPSHAVGMAETVAVKELLKVDDEFLRETILRLNATQAQALLGAPPAAGTDANLALQSKLFPRNAEQKEAALSPQDFLAGLSEFQWANLVDAGVPLFIARQQLCADRKPSIHTIGWHPVITFEAKTTDRATAAGERAVRIPVDGYDLDPFCVSIDVQIDGTIPISHYGANPNRRGGKADFHLTMPSDRQKDGLNIILLETYIDRLHTGDRVAIQVIASNKYYTPPVKRNDGSLDTDKSNLRRQAIARRVFQVYEAETYRTQVLRSRIRPDDINAFPLPETDARALFGPLVSSNYFVVRVSVRNTETDAKLISSGMIRAFGTAMIDSKVDGEPSFSVPVSVVPHSLQQIYTFISDEEVNQPRHQTFRTLEFIGALAAGAQGVFSYGAQAAKNVALFTGLIVPEGKKLWPDRWPGYQRNVVNYAMPDLMKVPANSVVDHKFLFFSKKELDGLVSDPNLFAPRVAATNINERRDKSRPDAFVIALAFDSLDIRFETMPVSVDLSAREMLRDLIGSVAEPLRELDLRKAWVSTMPLTFNALSRSEQADLIKNLGTAVKIDGKAGDDAKEVLKNTEQLNKRLLALAVGVAPGTAAGPSNSALAQDLYNSGGKFGLPALNKARERVNELMQRMAAGVDPEFMRDDIAGLNNTAKTSKALLEYYSAVAAALHEFSAPAKDVAKLLTEPLDAARLAKLKEFNTSAEAKLADLRAKRPLSASLDIPAQ